MIGKKKQKPTGSLGCVLLESHWTGPGFLDSYWTRPHSDFVFFLQVLGVEMTFNIYNNLRIIPKSLSEPNM